MTQQYLEPGRARSKAERQHHTTGVLNLTYTNNGTRDDYVGLLLMYDYHCRVLLPRQDVCLTWT